MVRVYHARIRFSSRHGKRANPSRAPTLVRATPSLCPFALVPRRRLFLLLFFPLLHDRRVSRFAIYSSSRKNECRVARIAPLPFFLPSLRAGISRARVCNNRSLDRDRGPRGIDFCLPTSQIWNLNGVFHLETTPSAFTLIKFRATRISVYG